MVKGLSTEAFTTDVTQIEQASVNDSDWRCTVGFLMDANIATVPYSKLIPEAISSGKRRVMYNISFLDIIKAIKQRPTNAKPAPWYGESYKKLCSDALSYENEPNIFSIPPNILACLLKVQILQIKAEAMRRSQMLADLAKRKEEDDQIIFARNTDVSQLKDAKSNKNGKSKSKGADEQQSVGNCPSKRNTKLRKRGEEWLDIEYIEDSPEDGPDAYIILCNFSDAKLTYELLRIGVPLQCIIKLEIDICSDPETDSSDTSSHVESSVPTDSRNQRRDTLVSMSASYRETELSFNRIGTKSRLSHVKSNDILIFWNELDELMYEPDTRTLYKEVAPLNLTIPKIPELPNDSEKQQQLKYIMYDQVSWLMYDLHDIIKQHELFLKKLVLQNVPITQNEKSIINMDVYSKIIDSIPNECCDALIIVNCLVEQVVASVEHSTLSADEYLTFCKEELVADIPGNDCIEKILQTLTDNYAMVETPAILKTDPLVLSFADRFLKRNYHYISKNLDLENVVYNILKCMPLFGLWDEYKINEIEPYQKHIELVGKYISSDPIPYHLISCYIYVYLFYNMHCSMVSKKQEYLEKKIKCRPKAHRNDKHIPKTIEEWCEAIVTDIILSVKDEKTKYAKTLPANAQSTKIDLNKLTFNMDDIQGNNSMSVLASNRTEEEQMHIVKRSSVSLRTEPNKLAFSSVNFLVSQKNANNVESGINLGRMRSNDQSKTSWRSKSSVGISGHKGSIPRSVLCNLQKSRSVSKNILRIPDMTEDKLKYRDLSEFLKYRMIEEMNSVAFLQAIRTASDEFYGVEHFYLDATDSILVRFFNPICTYGLTEKYFESYLTTACGLKDFCDYVLGNDWTWFEEEQEEKFITSTSLTSVTNLVPEISPYPFYIDADFIIPNSIKWNILHNGAQPEMYPESTGDKFHGAIKTKTDTGLVSISSDLSSSAELFPADNQDTGPSPVYGYDLGFDLRAQFSENHSICNLENGFNVKVNVREQLYFNKSACLQVEMFDSVLTYNFQLWPKVHGSERGDSFLLESGSGVRMFFKQIKGIELVNLEDNDVTKEVRFDLQLSLENGLYVTLEKNDLTDAVEYISQTYLVHHSVRSNIDNERKRCYLRNGQILKFLINDSIVLLCPDGRIFTFTLEKTPTKRVPSATTIIARPSFVTMQDHKKKRKSKFKSGSPDVETQPSTTPTIIHDFSDETPQPPFCVKEYSVLLPTGVYITNTDRFEREEEDKFLVRCSTDVGCKEVFVRRSDGTNILEKSDGSRIVAFPDGSRITAVMTVEDEETFCEWTYSEIFKYVFSAINFRVYGDREGACDTILLLDEGYVSVTLTHIMEHPNYATVTYKGNEAPIELNTVGDIKVIVSHDNLYDIKVRDVNVSIDGNLIRISSKDSCNATIELFTDTKCFNDSYYLCTARNEKGDCFLVNNDGSCLFVEKDNACPHNFETGMCQCEIGKAQCKCNVPEGSGDVKKFHYKDQRCFIMNRQLFGFELIHEDEVHSHLKEVQATRNGRVALLRPNLEKELCYIAAMVPVVGNESEKWLLPSEKARITREERELFTYLPSTYGTPPSWFHRFPLAAETPINVASYEPNVLDVRLFQEIFSSETDVISSMWSALNNYYNTSLQDTEPFESKMNARNSCSEQSLGLRDTIRSAWQERTSPAAGRIYQLALIYTTTKEEPQAYRAWVSHKASWAVSISNVCQRLRREKSNRKAFRENVFPPYFSSPEAEKYFLGEKIKKSLYTCVDNMSLKEKRVVPCSPQELSEERVVQCSLPEPSEEVPDETSSDLSSTIQNSSEVSDI